MFSCFVDLPQMPTAFYYWVTIKQADNRTTILQLSLLSSLDSLSVSVNVNLYATILRATSSCRVVCLRHCRTHAHNILDL